MVCGYSSHSEDQRSEMSLAIRTAIVGMLALASFCGESAGAQAADELYEAQAIVTGQREPERLRALPDCLEDALVKVKGWHAPVAAGSTVATVAIAQAIVAEVAAELAKRGIEQPVFVSPNVEGVGADNNRDVFAAYERAIKR